MGMLSKCTEKKVPEAFGVCIQCVFASPPSPSQKTSSYSLVAAPFNTLFFWIQMDNKKAHFHASLAFEPFSHHPSLFLQSLFFPPSCTYTLGVAIVLKKRDQILAHLFSWVQREE